MGADDELYYGDFERDGEETVRNNLAGKRYLPKKAEFAREWLARQERARSDSAQASQAATARSAADAAWEAARAAKSANTIATMALIAAIISIAISVIGVFLG